MQRILLWVGSLSFSAKHIDVLESVQPGTGTWLLEHATFRSWVKGDIEMLWCPGIRGFFSIQPGCFVSTNFFLHSRSGKDKTRVSISYWIELAFYHYLLF